MSPFFDDFWAPCWLHFRPFVVIVRIFFRVRSLTLVFEGSWPAKRRPGPQLGLVLGHSKTQKVSSCLGGMQVFALAAFSAAHSSWLLLSSSWGSSWPVLGTQNGPQIGPEVAQEASQKRTQKQARKLTKMGPQIEVEICKFLLKAAMGAGKLSRPLPGNALLTCWIIFAPKMAQEPHVDPNFAPNWPHFDPNSHQFFA